MASGRSPTPKSVLAIQWLEVWFDSIQNHPIEGLTNHRLLGAGSYYTYNPIRRLKREK